MPRSFLLGFVITYSVSQYVFQLLFSFMPINFQQTYMNYGLLSLSYLFIKYLKEERKREMEKYELIYLAGNEPDLIIFMLTISGSILALGY